MNIQKLIQIERQVHVLRQSNLQNFSLNFYLLRSYLLQLHIVYIGAMSEGEMSKSSYHETLLQQAVGTRFGVYSIYILFLVYMMLYLTIRLVKCK